ncbi:ROK family transcriptional regulator [Hoeflea prorocentri]|uniref:ROK family transcriptional regulator n=1 Tax=Hoeflea prorocentri TaxID=1922333 RepID=A0A9X3UIQ2_9HYPH|nr:ROK family transcriptional regulator [Hoeflea prorocentri]MCY6381399.1 ROK family transcriptional regulator [Hoeflea prorocentri]MDA5399199.1 ROK family transcriptional regulator [Hoeflea prorocentri]
MGGTAGQGRYRLSDSECEIMNIVRRHGSISRAAIADFTDLAQQSIHRIVDGLITLRLLRPQKAIIRGRGKPSPQIVLDTDTTATIGISISVAGITYCAADLAGSELCAGALDAPPDDREAVLGEITDVLSALQRKGPLSGRDIIGVGASIQGFRTLESNSFVTPKDIGNWSLIPLGELFGNRFAPSFFFENNATCAALAELYCGGGEEFRCFAYLSFTSGFGCGLIWDEKPLYGGHGNAGEIGTIFTPDNLVHRPALIELHKRLTDRGMKITYRQLLDEFDPEWPGVPDWIEEVMPSLNLCIRAFTAILDPNAVFFGGEAPRQLRQMLINACEPAQKDTHCGPKPFPKLLLSRIDGDAAILGATMLPLQHTVFRPRCG